MPQTAPDDWPGRAQANGMPFEQKAEVVEKALALDVAAVASGPQERFLPFVVMYEYEGLLFSDPNRFAEAIGRKDLTAEFQAIRNRFSTPEEINDSPATAPSKRVESLIPQYQKPLMGTLAAQQVGLAAIRKACPHFRQLGADFSSMWVLSVLPWSSFSG